MVLEFFRTSWAIESTYELFNIYHMKNHINRLAGRLNLGYLKDTDTTLLRMHELMEEEIMQVMLTNNKVGQVQLFELLASTLKDWRVESINVEHMRFLIEAFNEDKEEKYLQKLEEKVSEFINTELYKTKKHLDEYEVNHPEGFGILGGRRSAWTETKVYYRFYVDNIDKDNIDIDFLDSYVEYITPVINNYRRIVTKYVKQYYEGKLSYQDTFSLTNSTGNNNLPIAPHVPKIEFNLTIEQLAYLFKLLKNHGAINAKSDVDIQKFILENIAVSSQANRTIGSKSLKNKFSSPTKNTAVFIAALLKKMRDEAIGF